MWFKSIEYILPQRLGSIESFELFWVCTTDNLEQPGSRVWLDETFRRDGKVGRFGASLCSENLTINCDWGRIVCLRKEDQLTQVGK